MDIFESFVEGLEELELPLVLSRELQADISRSKEPMPSDFVKQYLTELSHSWDEFTELIPVGKISIKKEFTAIIFWKASLMNYEFIIYSFNKKGNVVDWETLASTSIEGDQIKEEVAIIEDDLLIFKAVSSLNAGEALVSNADESKRSTHMIKENGKIVQL